MYLKSTISIFLLAALAIIPAARGHSDNNDESSPVPFGLQKKYQALQKSLNQEHDLPPGWEQKLIVGEYLPENIYTHGAIVVPLDSSGLLTIRIENHVIRLIEATREIAAILE